MKRTINRYTKLEVNTIVQLRINGLSFSEISTKINEQFKSNRTAHSIECKLSELTKRDTVKNVKKLSNEDNILINHIKQHSTNIRHAITIASKELKISFNTLNNRYYKTIKHNQTILTVGSEIGFSNNVKNTIRDIDGNLPSPDMNDVQWLMKQILNLPEKDRNTIKLLLTN